MKKLSKQDALRIITIFSGAAKGMSFYPDSHPAIRQPLLELDKLVTYALHQYQTFSWGIIDGTLFFEEHLFIAPSTASADLVNRMLEIGVGRITLSSGLTFEELQLFVRLFSVKGSNFDQIEALLQQSGLSHVKLAKLGEEHAETQDETSQDESEGDHFATYGRAVDAIRGVCRDIECGRIPSSASIIRVVDRMADITMQDPSTLLGLSMIKDYDNYTFNHCVNVGVLSMALGASVGLDATSVRDLGIAGQLHDIGKTMIPKAILNKPGKLSSLEYEEMKRHSELGSKIIHEMEALSPQIAQIVLGHHLQHNRMGYPDWARTLPVNRLVDIVAIADSYDAITTLRVYQHPVNPRAALSELQKMVGTLLDGELFASFVELMGKYPVGTLVRLDTNEIAVIYRPNPLDEETPIVSVLFEPDGSRLSPPRKQPLVEQDGSRYASIVAVLDPLLKNIDVGKIVADLSY